MDEREHPRIREGCAMRVFAAMLLLVPSLALAAPGGGFFQSSPMPGEGTSVLAIHSGQVAWYLASGAVNTLSTYMGSDCVIWMNERHDSTGNSGVEATVYRDSGDGTIGLFAGILTEGGGGVRTSNGYYWIEVTSPPISAWARFTVSCVEDWL